jgi:hypothetical protein
MDNLMEMQVSYHSPIIGVLELRVSWAILLLSGCPWYGNGICLNHNSWRTQR